MGKNDDEITIILLGIVLVFLVIALIIQILYLMTLMKCLTRVAPRNRDMEPGMVWLNLVPCLNLVWIFITVNKVGSSLRKEFYDRGLVSDDESFGTGIGLAYAVLSLLGAIPYIGFIFSLGSLICFIIYWVKIAGFSARIAEPGRSRRRRLDDDDDDDDFDDDLGRPRSRLDREHDLDRRARDSGGEPDDRFRE